MILGQPQGRYLRYIECSDILSGDDCTVSRDPEGGMQVEGCEVKAIRRSTSNRSAVQEAWWMARSGSRKSRLSWNARRFAAVSRGPSSRPAVSRAAKRSLLFRRPSTIVDEHVDSTLFEKLTSNSSTFLNLLSYRSPPRFFIVLHSPRFWKIDFPVWNGHRCDHRLW